MEIKVSLLTSNKDKNPKDKILSYSELSNLLTTFNESTKDKARGIISGHFGGRKRREENLSPKSLLFLDVDSFKGSINDLEMFLKRELDTYRYLAYSTASYSPDKPKIRVVLFFSKEVEVTKYKTVSLNFIRSLSEELQHSIDTKASITPNQLMYLPIIPNKEYQPWFKENPGIMIDPIIDSSTDTLPADYSPINNGDTLLTTTQNTPGDYCDEEILNCLKNYPADNCDYHSWLEVGMALHHQFSGQLEGLNLWDAWSKPDSSRYKEREDLEDKWKSFKSNTNNPITFATIMYKIKKQPELSWVHRGKNGAPLSTIENYQLFFDQYGIKPTYNVIKKREKITSPSLLENIHSPDIEGDKVSEIYSLCVLHGLGKDEKTLRKYLSTVAHKNSFNPIKEGIEVVKPDGISRLEQFYSKIVVLEEHEEIKRVYLKKWLLQFICMTCLNDGERGLVARQVLVLQGKEGIGKTTFLKELLPTNLQDYFNTAAAVDLKDDMQVKKLIEHAIVEFGELPATFRKSDNDAFKAFITQSEDTINIKYQVNHSKYRRNTTFVASVNDLRFLNSSYENTRLLIIPVEKFEWDKKVDMLQLFAELFLEAKVAKKAAEEQGKNLESIYELTPDEQKLQKVLNQEFEEPQLWEELLQENLDLSNTDEIKKEKLSVTKIIERVRSCNSTKRDLNDCAAALRKLGLKPDGKRKYEVSFLIGRGDF